VEAAFAPGAVVSGVARRAEVVPAQIYRWRQELAASSCGFAEVVVASTGITAAADGATIELALPGGVHLRIPRMAPPDLAAAVVRALVRR
jgi:transposase